MLLINKNIPYRELNFFNIFSVHYNKSDIYISRDSQVVNGKSIMGVMMLAAENGATLVISANGEDEEDAVAALAALIQSKFNEE